MTAQSSYIPNQNKLQWEMAKDKRTKTILLQGLSHNGIYPIPCTLPSQSEAMAFLGQNASSSLWHRRLGHPTNAVVKLTLKNSQLESLNDDSSMISSSCLHGKMHRLPFTDTHIKTRIPFSRIHSDVWGPSHFKFLDSYTLLHFTLCATKRISSRKIHCSRTNFKATKTSSRRIRRAKIVKKDFARPSFSLVAQSDFA
ncbi:hypothetical protein L3X38_033674 [Prunus dulcis]|uniref:GAG-pre-integrase domain-containing protein n=1 Tax=Prunus dulcis TaxID=3755 RepID=A0AAD4VII2_PRUDU|nr:hypothetical protein L3X38_033674 [Prunus dulcis]